MNAATHEVPDRIATRHGSALWTLTGFILYVLGGMAAILATTVLDGVLLHPFGLRAEAGTLGLSVRNGYHAIVWGVLVAAVAAPLGRRLVDGIRFTMSGWAMLATGLALAAVVITLGCEFVRQRVGYYDPDAQGLSGFAGLALVAVALATWAALAVPAAGVLAPAAAVLTAAAGLAMSLLPSIPGAADGIAADSVPLGAAFLGGLAYAGLATILVTRRLGRSGS